MKQSVDTELEVAPIINRCRDDMKSIMSSVDHMVDNQHVIEKLKTGENPPADLAFEEIPCGIETKVGTLGRKKSKAKLNKSTEENSLFSKKKDLEKRAEDMESEIEKGEILRHILQFFILMCFNFRQEGNLCFETNGPELHKQSQVWRCLEIPVRARQCHIQCSGGYFHILPFSPILCAFL